MAKMINKTLVLTYIYLLINILLSCGVILYNKWVLSPKYFNFPLPITLTMIHMGFSGFVAFPLIGVFKVVSPVKMTFEIYVTCVVPISAFFASSLWFGNTAYLHMSVAFIKMLKALCTGETDYRSLTDPIQLLDLFLKRSLRTCLKLLHILSNRKNRSSNHPGCWRSQRLDSHSPFHCHIP